MSNFINVLLPSTSLTAAHISSVSPDFNRSRVQIKLKHLLGVEGN